MLIDPQAMCRPLLDAQPGTKAIASCRRCSLTIEGPAELDERGFCVHPGGCSEEAKKTQEKPQYRLL